MLTFPVWLPPPVWRHGKRVTSTVQRPWQLSSTMKYRPYGNSKKFPVLSAFSRPFSCYSQKRIPGGETINYVRSFKHMRNGLSHFRSLICLRPISSFDRTRPAGKRNLSVFAKSEIVNNYVCSRYLLCLCLAKAEMVSMNFGRVPAPAGSQKNDDANYARADKLLHMCAIRNFTIL